MPDIYSPYQIKQGTFEGPLELLLSLIETRKLFVNEISLAEVTNDYINYIKSFSDIPTEKHIEDVSYFILIAATLILIKSKSLLPNLSLTEDEEEKIVDLEARLKLFKIIKEASIEVSNNFGTKIIFMPNERIWSESLFSPDPLITQDSIFVSISEVLAHTPKKTEKLPEIEVRKIINIDEIINSLTDRIQNAINLSFKKFTEGSGAENQEEAKVHVIISFLAMLELVREGIIDVIQNTSFGDIEINKQNTTEAIPQQI
ncbi:MAG: segregation/condensation protein A [Candidatus Nomurabacteria bacterium]|nr:segregation/condensation protein A [Candidatus Nomurabacteria bacterium]